MPRSFVENLVEIIPSGESWKVHPPFTRGQHEPKTKVDGSIHTHTTIAREPPAPATASAEPHDPAKANETQEKSLEKQPAPKSPEETTLSVARGNEPKTNGSTNTTNTTAVGPPENTSAGLREPEKPNETQGEPVKKKPAAPKSQQNPESNKSVGSTRNAKAKKRVSREPGQSIETRTATRQLTAEESSTRVRRSGRQRRTPEYISAMIPHEEHSISLIQKALMSDSTTTTSTRSAEKPREAKRQRPTKTAASKKNAPSRKQPKKSQDASPKKNKKRQTPQAVKSRKEASSPRFDGPLTEAVHHARIKSRNKPLDPPPSPPIIPDHLQDRWTYNPTSRVLLADFRKLADIPMDDKSFLLQMMERDDISVVTEGMLKGQVDKIPLDAIAEAFAGKPYHKFRRYNRVQTANGTVVYEEVKAFVSMQLASFVAYVKLRSNDCADKNFDFVDAEGKRHHIDNVLDVVFYLIDCDLPKHLPRMYNSYAKSSFKMKECLPGGSSCMMSAIPETARPFMGPNLYISPGGGFTSFHQDGSGTVDSGHTCLTGYNEVVMLRRLPDDHKLHAMEYMSYGAVYEMPHEQRTIDSTSWPTNASIQKWTEMNYCPSVFILRPGQHLHINKSRLHCFRKLSPDPLPDNDCHALFRADLLKDLGPNTTPESFMCMSIAYDWMFLGVTEEGIAEEINTSLYCSKLCQEKIIKCLAVPATTILKIGSATSQGSNFKSFTNSTIELPPSVVCKGILPSLTDVVDEELREPTSRVGKVAEPDCICPSGRGTDPYGSENICKLCYAELGNRYFQCVGCAKLVLKDFNICFLCFELQAYRQLVHIHPNNKKRLCDLHHLGRQDGGRRMQPRECRCAQGTCPSCSLCKSCSCCCHHEFQERRRFYEKAELKRILNSCKAMAKKSGVKK